MREKEIECKDIEKNGSIMLLYQCKDLKLLCLFEKKTNCFHYLFEKLIFSFKIFKKILIYFNKKREEC